MPLSPQPLEVRRLKLGHRKYYHENGSSGGKSTLFCALVSSGWKAKAQGSRKGGVCVCVAL